LWKSIFDGSKNDPGDRIPYRRFQFSVGVIPGLQSYALNGFII
jgi:hypothetical protein